MWRFSVRISGGSVLIVSILSCCPFACFSLPFTLNLLFNFSNAFLFCADRARRIYCNATLWTEFKYSVHVVPLGSDSRQRLRILVANH
ncbi:uncharacterized protein EDB93DRAFT_1180945 [Suillus bovinus]|uniref:uncharacterized protein n=1 Tax=Suillus bovinus TaxID=48563 RepID=UPI001B86DCF8|nr:uncharacterized protein EDB93DRAFT_1180945 [Suillus bovinus]KAG2130208.1 hypothetical protein EDB93DRAFT_1180945 [Suillus bovinus]